MVLTPREYVVPVAEIVADERQASAPRLDDALDLLEHGRLLLLTDGRGRGAQLRERVQTSLDLKGLLQLDNLLGGLQQRHMSGRDQVRQAAPLLQRQVNAPLDLRLDDPVRSEDAHGSRSSRRCRRRR